MDTKRCIIFDIDGTLALIEHRRHFVEGGRKDWDAFFDAMVGDTPNVPVVELAEALSEYMKELECIGEEAPFEIFVCSGRPDSHRDQTESWLRKHVPALWSQSKALMMRKAGDYRSDVIVKREMLQAIRGQGYEPSFVVDDRQRVVDMWRQEGIVCLQCDASDWDKGLPSGVQPGDLYMMVGPSGSGKSTYVERYFDPATVVSSDQLRKEMTGDFRDQSMNAAVFAALHAIVKARIESGLQTVVDATNLRNRDRKAIRDLLTPASAIYYVLIDRPLDEKLRDAGWRSEVEIKGVPLIEKHDQTFRSNLRDILKGDMDPRVRIIDERS